jgi:transglutaminase-like putative cysteine protease
MPPDRPTDSPATPLDQRLTVSCRLDYAVERETTLVFNVMPALVADQRVMSARFATEPALREATWIDSGTGNHFTRIVAAPGSLSVEFSARVALMHLPDPAAAPDGHDSTAGMPMHLFPWINPTRYCPSDLMADCAEAQFGDAETPLQTVRAIVAWIKAAIDYRIGSSVTTTTALDTLADRAGVCRDFAHLGIALCRALDIPARYVTVYAPDLELQDFHALMEVYCGGRWRIFDATGKTAGKGFVRIGSGSDAAQVPFAALYGDCTMTGMDISAGPSDPDELAPPRGFEPLFPA